MGALLRSRTWFFGQRNSLVSLSSDEELPATLCNSLFSRLYRARYFACCEQRCRWLKVCEGVELGIKAHEQAFCSVGSACHRFLISALTSLSVACGIDLLTAATMSDLCVSLMDVGRLRFSLLPCAPPCTTCLFVRAARGKALSASSSPFLLSSPASSVEFLFARVGGLSDAQLLCLLASFLPASPSLPSPA